MSNPSFGHIPESPPKADARVQSPLHIAAFGSRPLVTSLLSTVTPETRVVTRAGVCPFNFAEGSMAIGELRSQLMNYVVARSVTLRGGTGTFTFRCDDTDSTRSDLKYLRPVFELFSRTLGITIDLHPYNSVALTGASMIQTERAGLYGPFVELLKERGFAVRADNGALLFDADRFAKERTSEITVYDSIFGPRTFSVEKSLREDRKLFPITRSDGSVLWNLASTLDDYLTGVNLVIRGQDKLPIVPFQEMIRIALDLPVKEYMHLPLMQSNPNEGCGPLMLFRDILRQGVAVQSVISYLFSSMYGSPDGLYHSIDDFAESFDPKKVHTKSSQLSLKKLHSIDASFRRSLPSEAYRQAWRSYVDSGDQDGIASAALDPAALTLIESLRRNFRESAQLLKDLETPVFSSLVDRQSSAVGEILPRLKAFPDASVSALSELSQLSGALFHEGLRWILTGKCAGAPVEAALLYLRSKGCLDSRIVEASTVLKSFGSVGDGESTIRG